MELDKMERRREELKLFKNDVGEQRMTKNKLEKELGDIKGWTMNTMHMFRRVHQEKEKRQTELDELKTALLKDQQRLENERARLGEKTGLQKQHFEQRGKRCRTTRGGFKKMDRRISKRCWTSTGES